MVKRMVLTPSLLAFQRLLDIMDELREKCPWDKKQTFESLRTLTIEETYELVDAILKNDNKGIEEEVGDLLLHAVFYCKIGQESGDFDITSALNGICDKLVKRHPHIYGNEKVQNEEDVKRNWEKIKLQANPKKKLLGGVPDSLPAMIKAYRMQQKAQQIGFDWPNIRDVRSKISEEFDELEENLAMNADTKLVEEEMGDILFSIINYSRFVGIDPELALEKTNLKFKNRISYIEDHSNKPLNELSLEEMEDLWQQSKVDH